MSKMCLLMMVVGELGERGDLAHLNDLADCASNQRCQEI